MQHRVRVPGWLGLALVVITAVSLCLVFTPADEDRLSAGPSLDPIIQLSAQPMTAEQSDLLCRLTAERTEAMKSAGKVPIHPSKLPPVKSAPSP